MTESHNVVSDPFTVTFIRVKARQLCRRSDFSWSDYEDLQQDMRVHLLEKAHLFDPERGTVAAFVTRILRTWVAMQLRYRRREKRRDSFKALSLERAPVERDGDIAALGVILVDQDGRRLSRHGMVSAEECLEQREAVAHAMGHLDPKDQEILTHVAEFGVARASRAFGVSRRQIDNAVARARAQFEKAGLRHD